MLYARAAQAQILSMRASSQLEKRHEQEVEAEKLRQAGERARDDALPSSASGQEVLQHQRRLQGKTMLQSIQKRQNSWHSGKMAGIDVRAAVRAAELRGAVPAAAL